jgi:hypothetical protein
MPLQSSYGPTRLHPYQHATGFTASKHFIIFGIMPGHGASLLVRPLTQACTFAPRAPPTPLLEALKPSHFAFASLSSMLN